MRGQRVPRTQRMQSGWTRGFPERRGLAVGPDKGLDPIKQQGLSQDAQLGRPEGEKQTEKSQSLYSQEGVWCFCNPPRPVCVQSVCGIAYGEGL